MDEMDTLAQRMTDLHQRGWDRQLIATADGIRCNACGATVAPEDVTVDAVHRFEGESNPEDEAILFAISTPDGHRGTLVATYGPETPTEEADVLRRLPVDPD